MFRNLLITTIGKQNFSHVWSGGGRKYDVVTVDYTKTPTFKYPGIYNAVTDCIWDYDYFWMPDEDVYLEPADINRMFNIMKEYNLDIAQPSIEDSNESFPSWRCFVHDSGDSRDVIPINFVEVTGPCFSRSALLKCIETFELTKSGWGIDLAWGKIMKGENMGIINSVVAKHTRPVGGGKLYDILSKNKVSPAAERKKIMRKYGIPEIIIIKDGHRFLNNNI